MKFTYVLQIVAFVVLMLNFTATIALLGIFAHVLQAIDLQTIEEVTNTLHRIGAFDFGLAGRLIHYVAQYFHVI